MSSAPQNPPILLLDEATSSRLRPRRSELGAAYCRYEGQQVVQPILEDVADDVEIDFLVAVHENGG